MSSFTEQGPSFPSNTHIPDGPYFSYREDFTEYVFAARLSLVSGSRGLQWYLL